MRGSLSSYRESLSRIAGEVFDPEADDDLAAALSGPSATPSPPASRRLWNLPHSSPSPSPSSSSALSEDEVAKWKADVQRLQASEADLKALSYNYAAILKEKEEQLSKLREENGSLKKNLESTVAGGYRSNGISEKLSARGQRNATQELGNHASTVRFSMQNGHSTTVVKARQPNGIHRARSSSDDDVENTDVLEESNVVWTATKTSLENKIKELTLQGQSERERVAEVIKKLEDEQKRSASLQKELSELRTEKDNAVNDLETSKKLLHDKTSELERLHDVSSPRDNKKSSDESVEMTRTLITSLQTENKELQIEKTRLEQRMKTMVTTVGKNDADKSESAETISNLQKVTEEMASSISVLKRRLADVSQERDRALQELNRLKKHLLDKEHEDEEKMDQDSQIIEELQETCEQQKSHIMQLERALKLEIAKREDRKKLISEELQRSNETISSLQQNLANCMTALQSKNEELLNLQTALGQYYAESEAKEHLAHELALERKELAKLSELLKDSNAALENSRREKEDIARKLTQADKMLADSRRSMQKLEDDNARIRHALEKSMTTLNRMSLDSDNSVDRRIVIKLLVTYFQRNHSKEVLDLMVRMLGFSEEDKQRIGLAHHNAGKGVVRGVLGFPGRVVGGILGGRASDTSSHVQSDNQSFADLWVDFLLKETEERERKESSEAAGLSPGTSEKNSAAVSSGSTSASSYQSSSVLANAPAAAWTSQPPPGHSGSEFASIPLTTASAQSSYQNPFARPSR